MTETIVKTFAGYNKTEAVSANINAACNQASWSRYGGLHVVCKSTDTARTESMQPHSDFCILHALLAKNNSGEFICPAGLTSTQILEIERTTEVKY